MRASSAATVVIVLLAVACGGQTATPTPGAPTEAPSANPTSTPTGAPTDAPTPGPTSAPTPTGAPPTQAPPSATGKGVTIAILDRGIDYTHPDFLNPDGTTRIKAALDLSAQTNWCEAGRPDPVEYTEGQINDSLASGSRLLIQDAVGHGTATAGLAAGNGSALASHLYAGVAPEADLVIVKLTSEGAPAHDGIAAEAPFNGCVEDAITWLDGVLDLLDQPAVAIWNAGSQWGPIDGTSATSRLINRFFPPDEPGRVWVATSGDEGGLPNHAALDFAPDQPAIFNFALTGDNSYPSAWFTGGPAEVTISLDDGTVLGPFGERDTPPAENGVYGFVYEPGAEFYPWESTSGDHAVYFQILGHAGDSGTIEVAATGQNGGHVDVYGDVLGPDPLTSSINFANALVEGRVSDQASTNDVIVTGVHVALDSFVNIDGVTQNFTNEGRTGELWYRSSGGPTRDGRDVVDLTAAGQNVPAALGSTSWWSAPGFRFLWPQDGEGHYMKFGGTSAAGPIVAGTVALMLELNPTLTMAEVREILRSTATADEFTGAVPNPDWGYGKLDIAAALAAAGGAF